MLQDARPGDGPFFSHMADNKDSHPAGFSQLSENTGALPDLAYAPRGRADRRLKNNLDRINDHYFRFNFLDVLNNQGQVRLVDYIEAA